MSTAPLVSVVIPTRNRGHRLPSALTTALSQTFDDYEIVVSDNFSADGTRDVVGERATECVRYVRTDRVLSMPDHWEFAFDQARGRPVRSSASTMRSSAVGAHASSSHRNVM